MGELKSTTYLLQFANKSLEHSRGIIEGVLVKVDKFTLLDDFVVLNIEEDELETCP